MASQASHRITNLLFILILPVLSYFHFLKTGNIRRYFMPMFFFLVFYGLCFVIPDSGDAYRHYQSFLLYPEMTWSQFWQEFGNIVTFKSVNHSDLYVFVSNFILSRATTSSSFYFGFHALVYSLIYLSTLRLILVNVQVHKTLITTFFFLLLVLIAPINKIQFLRYYLAAWLFLYGAFSILMKRGNRYYLYFLLSVLVHFSFLIPSALFVVYVFFRKKVAFWLILALFSFTSNNFLSQYTTVIGTLSQAYFSGGALTDKTKAYVENEEYIAQRSQRFDDRRWYANPAKYLGGSYTVLLFLTGILLLSKRIVIERDLVLLYTFALFTFSVAQLGNAFASFGERFELVFFIAFSAFGLHFFYRTTNQTMQRAAYLCMPFFSIFLIMALREEFFVGDLFVFIGNPLVAFFVERTSLLSYLIN